MNNPNPLIPQGSILERQARGKPHLRIALCIVAVHVVFLGLLLMQGCKREDDPLSMTELRPDDVPFPPLDVERLYATNDVTQPPAPGRETVRVPDDWPGPETIVTTPPPAFVPPPTPAPTPTVPTPTPDVGRVREHTVAAGDTYTSLAKRYETTVSAIAKANPGVDPTRLRIGQRLLIPPAEPRVTGEATEAVLPSGVQIYTVQSGDTLTSIARRHGTTVSVLRELNGLTSDRILVNQELMVPTTNTTERTTR
jgi:LysM repeat protein